jgi:hypothetical protein
MKTHTPGPWHLVSHRPNLIKVETARVVICDAFGGLSDETMSNAHLIASAPDLLASLVELESMVAEMLPKHGPCGWGELALNQARQAIAKATGNNA